MCWDGGASYIWQREETVLCAQQWQKHSSWSPCSIWSAQMPVTPCTYLGRPQDSCAQVHSDYIGCLGIINIRLPIYYQNYTG